MLHPPCGQLASQGTIKIAVAIDVGHLYGKMSQILDMSCGGMSGGHSSSSFASCRICRRAFRLKGKLNIVASYFVMFPLCLYYGIDGKCGLLLVTNGQDEERIGRQFVEGQESKAGSPNTPFTFQGSSIKR